MATTVFDSIKERAAMKLSGKYNLIQFKSEKAALKTQIEICKRIVAFSEAHPEIPIYFILQVGVSKGAFQRRAFEKGYKSFDENKVLIVFALGQVYLRHNGLVKNGKVAKLSDVGIRLIMRWYEHCANKEADTADIVATFEQVCAKSAVLGKRVQVRETPYSELCKNLGIPITERETTADPNDLAEVA